LQPADALPDTAEALPSALSPSSSDMKTAFLGGLFLLALLAAFYAAREIVMPFLQKYRVPRLLAAVSIMVILGSGFAIMGTLLASPAASWAEKIPNGIPKLQERLGFISHPLNEAQNFMAHAEDLTKGSGPKVIPVALQGTRLSDRIVTGTRALAGGLFTTAIVLFFLLLSGDTFLRRLVEILPRFQDKRQAVDISQQIEQDIAGYLLTITCLNAGVGAATAMVALFTGLGDPVLWGTMAFLLNYVPILGPLCTASVLLLAGLMANIDGAAFLPAILYFFIHIMEGTFITPLLLAKRFTLNPVVVILSLIFWYWMWGIPGAIMAMPMLAATKIICDRIKPLMAFGHFLEG
jgi:predicted PurR-regulated permease PerM